MSNIKEECVDFQFLIYGCVGYSFQYAPSHSFRSVSCVFAILCGTQPNGSRPRCLICCDYVIESAAHIIFECSGLQINRRTLFNELVTSMPVAMREEFMYMNSRAKLTFILSGLGGSKYVPEWQQCTTKCNVYV